MRSMCCILHTHAHTHPPNHPPPAGFLLDLPSNTACQPIVDLIISRFLPAGTQAAPFILPPSLLQQPQQQPAAAHMLQQQHSVSSSGTLPPHMQLHGQGSVGMQGGTPFGGAQGSGGMQGPASYAAVQQQLLQQQQQQLLLQQQQQQLLQQQQQQGGGQQGVHSGLRTLWVGQVHESVTDDMLLGAFRRFGDVVSYRIIRSSHCAFVDFGTHAAAAEALRNLNGARMGSQVCVSLCACVCVRACVRVFVCVCVRVDTVHL